MSRELSLEGEHVRLVPLSMNHADDLLVAATKDRSTYAFTQVPGTLDDMTAYIAHALEQHERGVALPFATIDLSSGLIAGATRFDAIERYRWPEGSRHMREVDSVEIGWTWLAHSAQRTAINTEAKYLMLRHAFEVWGCHRVVLKTDARNQRSRQAIERLGARFEGVWRAAAAGADGTVRDSAYFSITEPEWPEVSAGLESRLARHS